MGSKPLLPGVIEERYVPPVKTTAIGTATTGTCTVTVAAGAAGIRHVASWLSFNVQANGPIALTLTTVGVALIDGTTGGTTYLWREVLQVLTTGVTRIFLHNLDVFGSAATAMTAEFSGTVTNGWESVNLGYYDIK